MTDQTEPLLDGDQSATPKTPIPKDAEKPETLTEAVLRKAIREATLTGNPDIVRPIPINVAIALSQLRSEKTLVINPYDPTPLLPSGAVTPVELLPIVLDNVDSPYGDVLTILEYAVPKITAPCHLFLPSGVEGLVEDCEWLVTIPEMEGMTHTVNQAVSEVLSCDEKANPVELLWGRFPCLFVPLSLGTSFTFEAYRDLFRKAFGSGSRLAKVKPFAERSGEVGLKWYEIAGGFIDPTLGMCLARTCRLNPADHGTLGSKGLVYVGTLLGYVPEEEPIGGGHELAKESTQHQHQGKIGEDHFDLGGLNHPKTATERVIGILEEPGVKPVEVLGNAIKWAIRSLSSAQRIALAASFIRDIAKKPTELIKALTKAALSSSKIHKIRDFTADELGDELPTDRDRAIVFRDNGKKRIESITNEQRSKGGKKGMSQRSEAERTELARQGGVASAESLGTEGRSERARKAAKARWGKKD